MRHLISSLLLVFYLMPTPAPGADSRNAPERLDGVWELTTLVDDGATAPANTVQGTKAVFARTRMTLISPDGSEKTEYTIKIDSAQNPNAFDMTSTEGSLKGQASRGIYKLDGQTLQLCAPLRPTGGRPSTFAAPQGSGLFLMILKKISD